MTRADETTSHRLPDEVNAKLRAVSRRLWVERGVRAFWPIWCVLALGLSLWLIGLFDAVAPLTAAAIWAGLAALAAAGTVHALRNLSRPDPREALRRLDESVADRAVTMLDDDLAVGRGSGETERLWQAHRDRLARDAAKAKVPDADIRLAAFDRWNLRYAALGLLAMSWGFSRVGGAETVAALLDPTPSAAQAATLVPSLEAWAAPPPYTGVAPVYLTERIGETISVPTGSVLTLRATGIEGAPTLGGTALAESSDATFAEEAAGVFGLTATLTGDGTVSVGLADAAASEWRFEIEPDAPPQIAIEEAPKPSAQRELAFSYSARDDYGVSAIAGAIVADRREMTDPPEELDEPIALDLPLPSAFDEAALAEVAEDLTRHPLAGSPVTMVLEAEDGAGQRAQAEPQHFILPARIFTEPMAKAIIEQRRALAWDIRHAWDVLDLLEAVTAYPDDYFTDTATFLAVSTAIKRLNYALDEERVAQSRDEILDLLWEAAIRLEEGDLDNALEQLRAAQRRLKDALERGASDEELEQLMNDLRQAMRDYLDEMARQAMRQEQNGDQQQGQQDQQALTREDLERLLDQLEESAKSGAREQAEQMLSMLGEMLENLRMGQSQQGQGGQGAQQESALQDMLKRQQELADETFRQLQEGQNGREQNRPGQGQQGQQEQGEQGQQGQQGQGQMGEQQGEGQGQRPGEGRQGQGQAQRGQGQGGSGQQQTQRGGQPGGRGLSGEQEGLRGDLQDLLPGIDREGDAGRALREAERDMGSATEDLGTGDLNSALDDQARALDRLREGAQALARENRREAQQNGRGQQNGEGNGAEVGQNAERLDPFGRVGRTFGPDDGLGVEVPGERARNRALEIQREIRKREAERERPESERDYLRRLQDRF